MNRTAAKYAAVAATAVGVAVILYLGLSSSGAERYAADRDLLLEVERNFASAKIAVLYVKVGIGDDFDSLTERQLALRDSAARLAMSEIEAADQLHEALVAFDRSIDDVKRLASIYRNSVASFDDLSVSVNNHLVNASADASIITQVAALEKAVLEFTFLHSGSAEQYVRATVAALESHADFEQLRSISDWNYLKLHVEKLLELVPQMASLNSDSMGSGVYPALQEVRSSIADSFSHSNNRAQLFQHAFLFYAFFLVLFAAHAAWKLNAYVRHIESRRAALETEVEQRTAELVQAQKLESIGQLAAGIAHEINTPAQFVGDNTRFLREAFTDFDKLLAAYAALYSASRKDQVTSDVVEAVGDAVEAADLDYLMEEIPAAIDQSLDGIGRISSIVSAMKEFSHPGGEQKEHIDLNKKIANTVVVASNEWKYVAELSTEYDEDLPPVACHPQEISQAVLNIVVNAAHAIAKRIDDEEYEKGEIAIRTKRLKDVVQIQISDNGCGMPEHVREKVFDLFFTTKGVGKGTGQGLSIAYSSVVDKHNGTIVVESEPGAGTTFRICLPLAEPGASHEANAA